MRTDKTSRLYQMQHENIVYSLLRHFIVTHWAIDLCWLAVLSAGLQAVDKFSFLQA
jgi:hypothetical protein